eukprot:12801326-Heterocapsa_arctica.AAC.1
MAAPPKGKSFLDLHYLPVVCVCLRGRPQGPLPGCVRACDVGRHLPMSSLLALGWAYATARPLSVPYM